MGVIETDRWLEEYFYDSFRIEESILDTVNSREQLLIESLYHNGLYRPNGKTNSVFQYMKEKNMWESLKYYLSYYKEEWNGPDLPVLFFPLASKPFQIFRKEQQGKSGISFIDKLFLFISDRISPKELEALFVHEYHHSTRLIKLNGDEDFTLADTIVMEGLAEYAVQEYCGEEYLAPWIFRESDHALEDLWKKHFKPHLKKKRTDPIHDKLLFGTRTMPKMAGYAVGYQIVHEYAGERGLDTKQLLDVPAERILKPFLNE